MDRSTVELVGLITANSRAVAYDLVEPLLRVLMTCHSTFGGDLEKAMIMMAITVRSSRHPDFRKLDDERAGALAVLPGYGTNMRSVAESIGMPKETVRRKVQQLLDAGWIARSGTHLCYSVEGYNAVEPVRNMVTQMYARGYGVVGALARAAVPN